MTDPKPYSIERLRARLRTMNDDMLQFYGRAAARMSQPDPITGEADPEAYRVQLDEARAEWRSRHQKQSPQ